MSPPTSEFAPMTPTDRHGKHDLEDLKRRSSIGGSEDGTAATECESTPTTLSDSNMEFSPFMLPEMEEGDLESTDDATMVSAMSRMSAPFIQFAPSILPGAIPEEALSQVGLNTVAAENKPSNVACVNTINFLSEPEPKKEEAAPAAPPIQIDLKPSTRRKKRGSVTKSPPHQGLQRRLSGQGKPNGGFMSSAPPTTNYSDDGSIGPSSVHSAPALSASRSRAGGGFKRVQMGHLGGPRGIPSINGGRPIRRRDPSLDMMAAPPSMMGGRPTPTGRRRDPSIDMMAGPPMAMMGLPRGPSRTSSLPAQHHAQPTRRSSSMLPTTSSHHAYGGDGGGDDVSVASGASRNSARSMPASRSNMAYNQHISRNDPRRGSMGRRGSGSHAGPPPTAPTQLSKAQSKEQRKEKKKKGGMFKKMFSNHIQTDFNGQVVESVAQEMDARATVPGGAMDDNSDYGVMPSRSNEGNSRSDTQSVTKSVPSEEGNRSRASGGTQRNSVTESSSTSASAHNGVRLRSDSFGNNAHPPMMDNPCVPDSMKVVEPPRAAALVRSNSGRMIRAPEDDSGGKKGRMKNLFKRNKDKKAAGVESAPVLDAACGYA